MTPILFLKTRDSYGCFSNFSPHTVNVWGYIWQTSEAAYQAMKYYPTHKTVFDAIREAPGPRKAADIGRKSSLMTPVWESEKEEDLLSVLNPINAGHLLGVQIDDGRGPTTVIERYKDAIMYRVVLAKAMQHRFIGQTLLDTLTRPIVENFSGERYWSWGPDHKGLNKLGKTWMLVRNELPKQFSTTTAQ
jgi:predicted NAD-dependent protein-ADP-ribosyltransferase YbiA (DUF1768 family)